MDELADLLREMLAKLEDISDSLSEISNKLDNVSGVYGIDDVVSKISDVESAIGTAVDDIVGGTRYNLTDIHNDFNRNQFNPDNERLTARKSIKTYKTPFFQRQAFALPIVNRLIQRTGADVCGFI